MIIQPVSSSRRSFRDSGRAGPPGMAPGGVDARKTRFRNDHSVYGGSEIVPAASTEKQQAAHNRHCALNGRPSLAKRGTGGETNPGGTSTSYAALGRGRSRTLTCKVSDGGFKSAPSLTGNTAAKLREPLYKTWCRIIVDNRWTVTLTTLLTIFVLVCDDVRILGTNKPADIGFNMLLVFCIVVFGTEVILSSIGKTDYFLGFFFWLDLIATSSLLLDLPWVQEYMHGGDTTADNVNDTARGRTARIGGRAARLVRILRLIRIVKLYKVAVTAIEKKLHEQQKKKLKPGEVADDDDWKNDDTLDPETGSRKESRVGKKLAEITTRRVIVLILAMLIVVPALSAAEGNKYPVSPFYGSDEV